MKPICLFGLPGSGKTTLANYLEVKYGYRKILQYTTRPPRKDETNGKDYYFITYDKFYNAINKDFFAEYTIQNPNNRLDWYGTAKKDLILIIKPTVMISNPYGIIDLIMQNYNLTLVFLNETEKTCVSRMKQRGDTMEEITRRMDNDIPIFSDLITYLNNRKLLFYCVSGHSTEHTAEIIFNINKTEG